MTVERPAVPARIAWAVELVDPAPGDRVLEVGCGNGTAAVLVAERLVEGRITAIDRSATAVARTLARGAAQLAAGRLRVVEAALAELHPDEPGRGERFDVAFAVNVNAFWTGAAPAAGAALRELLVPGGRAVLVYEAPGERSAEVAARAAATLGHHGLDVEVLPGPAPTLVAVSGRSPGPR